MTRRSIFRFVFCASFGLACAHAPPTRTTSPQVQALSADEQAAVIAAVTRLFDEATAKVPVCVQLVDAAGGHEVGASVLSALAPRARTKRDCPPIYASPIVTPETKSRPPGYIDPYELDLHWPTTAETATTVTARLWHGTAFTDYRCEVRMVGANRAATCAVTRQGVS